MSVSAVSNGSSMFMHSSKMMEDAAREIQQASLPVESTIGKPIDPTLQPAPPAPKSSTPTTLMRSIALTKPRTTAELEQT